MDGESEEMFSSLVSNIPGIVYRCAADDVWTMYFISETVKEISGYHASDFINNQVRTWESVIHPDDRDWAGKIAYDAIEKKESYTIRYRIINSKGEIVWVYEKGQGIFGKNSELLWLDGAIFDITQQKKTEQKLEESEKKYKKAFNLLNFYKDLFAHDMNNILQALNSTVEFNKLVRENPEKMKKVGDFDELLRTQINRGKFLISNVRKLSDIEEVKQELQPIYFDNVLNKAVEDAINSFHEKNVKIKIKGLSKDMKLLGNEFLVDIFDNILNNAIKYNDNEKEVKVEVNISKIQEDGKDFIKFEFKDYGMGITDKKKEYLFERQYTKDISQRGMGM